MIVSGSPESPAAPSMAVALLAWLSIQLVALLAGGLGLQLSARVTASPQAWSIQELVVVQMLAAALLGPVFFTTRDRAAAALATGMPFLGAAGYFAAISLRQFWQVALIDSLWLLAIGRLAGGRSARFRIGRRLIATLLVSGDVAVNYLRSEWTDRPALLIGPITGTLRSLDQVPVAIWATASLACIASFAVDCLVDKQRNAVRS